MNPPLPKPPQLFISYAREDEPWLDRLLKHLQLLADSGEFSVWTDKKLQPGDEWESTIHRALADSQAALLLVSPDFLTSRFIRTAELPALLQRRAEQDEVKILPLFVRESVCDAARLRYPDPNLGPHHITLTTINGVNSPESPLSKLSPQDVEAALVLAAKRIATAMQSLGSQRHRSEAGSEPAPKLAPGTVQVLDNPFREGNLVGFLEGAQSALLIGHSLRFQVYDIDDAELSRAIASLPLGFRVVLLDPRLPDLTMVAKNYNLDGSELKIEIRQLLGKLRRKCSLPAASIRLSQVIPCVNTYLRYGPKRHTIICGLYLHMLSVFKRPYLQVDSDHELFDHFAKQAELLWEKAQVLSEPELDQILRDPFSTEHLTVPLPKLSDLNPVALQEAVQQCVARKTGTQSSCRVVS